MNKNVVIVLLVIAVLGVGAYALINRNTATNQPSETTVVVEEDNTTADQNQGEAMQPTSDSAMTDDNGGDRDEQTEVKEFEVSGANFAFTPNTMTVERGDTVRITFTNTDESMPHDWVIDEFNARTQILQPGESETIEFVADEDGEFEFYCSVGNHRAQGMVGTLTVQ